MSELLAGEQAFLATMASALSAPGAPALAAGGAAFFGAEIFGAADWGAYFAVAELAAASVAAAGLALRDAARLEGATVEVDRRRAALWFIRSLAPQGWPAPPQWALLSGDYRASDGWIRLHCNAAAHAAAAQRVLGGPAIDSREAAGPVAAAWTAEALERAIVEAGGAAARMRAEPEWRASAEGAAVAAEPLVRWAHWGDAPPKALSGDPARPLGGLRVLDMTRVLAGPTATRFLAGFGAQVLRLDPPEWDEATLAPEMTLGKRCAALDLRQASDRPVFEQLLREADLFVHGLRPGALEGLGYPPERLRALNPSLPSVRICAYGWSAAPGAWAGRRGFDSLVQMTSGIAAHGMAAAGADRPIPLPAQALDYATGYLAAAAACQALGARARSGRILSAKLSLARTAILLQRTRRAELRGEALAIEDADLAPEIEATAWGPARRLAPPMRVGAAQMRWTLPAGPIRSAPPAWPEP